MGANDQPTLKWDFQSCLKNSPPPMTVQSFVQMYVNISQRYLNSLYNNVSVIENLCHYFKFMIIDTIMTPCHKIVEAFKIIIE